MGMTIEIPEGYEELGLSLQGALEQASAGKGKARHAEVGESFGRQAICEIGRRLGSGYCLGQAVKKIYESVRLPREASLQEIYGAINYLSAQAILIREGIKSEGGGAA